MASNSLLSFIVSAALADAGLERRGEIIQLVMTMRGGDKDLTAAGGIPGRKCHAALYVGTVGSVQKANRR